MTARLTTPAHTATGAFIMNFDELSEGRFAFDAGEFCTWLDSMALGKRIIVVHHTRCSDEVAAYWSYLDFDVMRVGADNDNASKAVLDAVEGFDRIFVASSPSDIAQWSRAINAPVFVACTRTPHHRLADDVRQRATAVHYLERLFFPLPAAIAIAA